MEGFAQADASYLFTHVAALAMKFKTIIASPSKQKGWQAWKSQHWVDLQRHSGS
jgi:hypothetical protein